MTRWSSAASRELTEFARSSPPGSGRKAGQLYEFAHRLTVRRAAQLPGVAGGPDDIRWWEFGEMSIYFRVDRQPLTVLKVGETRTAEQRKRCEADARDRC